MAAVTIRNLPDEVHRAIKILAAEHGRSTEAEIRAILEQAANAPDRLRLGAELAAIGREFGGVDLDVSRDKTPAQPPDLR